MADKDDESKTDQWHMLKKMVGEWEELPPNEVPTREAHVAAFSPFLTIGPEDGLHHKRKKGVAKDDN